MTLPSNTTSSYGSQFTLGNTDSTTVIASVNYAFMGWSDSSTVYSAASNYTIGLSDVVFTAQWIAIYTVHYNLNGGTGTVDADRLYLNGDPFTTSVAPSRTGYVFAGWVDQSGATFSAGVGTTVTDSRYIFGASWTPAPLEVTYNFGTGSGTAPSKGTPNYGTNYTLASQGSMVAPAGSIFDGWLIGAIKYGAGSTILITQDESATAQWLNNTFSIYFDLNGGNSGALTPISGAASAAATLPSNPTKAGYTFAGWNTGSSVLAANATSATIGSSNTTYVATWTLAAPDAPTISGVTAGDGSATIAVAPSNTGGTPTSYTITALDSSGNPLSPNATCTVVSPATTCTIAGLTNGTQYKFSAIANNSTGSSSATITSTTATPAGSPGAPTGVTAVPGNGQATVSLLRLQIMAVLQFKVTQSLQALAVQVAL